MVSAFEECIEQEINSTPSQHALPLWRPEPHVTPHLPRDTNARESLQPDTLHTSARQNTTQLHRDHAIDAKAERRAIRMTWQMWREPREEILRRSMISENSDPDTDTVQPHGKLSRCRLVPRDSGSDGRFLALKHKSQAYIKNRIALALLLVSIVTTHSQGYNLNAVLFI